jgi:hypothetical protein
LWQFFVSNLTIRAVLNDEPINYAAVFKRKKVYFSDRVGKFWTSEQEPLIFVPRLAEFVDGSAKNNRSAKMTIVGPPNTVDASSE